MNIIRIMGIVNIAGGIWCFQDGLASILYYLGRKDEKWYYNHALRIFRCLWGIAFIICGVIIL